MAASTRILAARGALLLLLLGVGVGFFFLWWPTCLASPSYDFTVTAITFPGPGKFRIQYEDRLLYGWAVSWQYDFVRAKGGLGSRVNEHEWSYKNPGFFRWPKHTPDQELDFESNLEEGPPGTPVDEATLRRRILLKPGSYRIHPGEKLVFYRGGSRDGKVLEGVIEMKLDVPDQSPLEYKPDRK